MNSAIFVDIHLRARDCARGALSFCGYSYQRHSIYGTKILKGRPTCLAHVVSRLPLLSQISRSMKMATNKGQPRDDTFKECWMIVFVICDCI